LEETQKPCWAKVGIIFVESFAIETLLFVSR
jgi:hypothetical protein